MTKGFVSGKEFREKRNATHEAGHAIAASSFGLPVIQVRLENGGGNCDYEPKGATFDDLIVIALAGPAAETFAFGKNPDSGRWKSDWDSALELSQLAGLQPAEFQNCIDRAAQLVKATRTHIAWVARRLLQDRVLSGRALQQALPRELDDSDRVRKSAMRRGPVLLLRRLP